MFTYLNDILFLKKGDSLENVDSESDYNMYMMNRWVSMYSPEVCTFINATVNWLHPIFETKQYHYQFLLKVLPRYRRKFIQYIKKSKEDNDEEAEKYAELLSTNLELSKREVKYLIEQQKNHERQHRPANPN